MKTTTYTHQNDYRFLLAGAALLLAMILPSTLRASERWETLEAIHAIENPSNSDAPGRHGELGAYQFRQKTWRMHSKLPFSFATDRSASDDVAIRHYEWIKAGLIRAGMEVTPYTIGLAWNGGLEAATTGRVGAATRDYAERVSNTAQQLRMSQLASTK